MHRSFLPPKKIELRAFVSIVLALLAVTAYIPAQLLPFISDDYIQVQLARDFGPVSGWPKLADDALYRCRATSLLITYWTEQLFGSHELPFKLTSVTVHVLNVFLVLALGVWRPIGFRISALAAAFFAVAEGHQEAVIWYAALPELLVFTFTLLTFLSWIQWLQSEPSHEGWYGLTIVFFLLALLSKESAVAALGLLFGALLIERKNFRQRVMWLMPLAAIGALYFVSIYSARSTHLHFNDGTFSLSAPFAKTVAISTGRMLWFWGYAAIATILFWRKHLYRHILIISAAWIVIGFLPYAFLTYMPRVPSRHTYLASVGLALIVGAAYHKVLQRSSFAAGLLAFAVLAHNFGYLWFYKQRQFAERAAATEELVRFASRTSGTVYVRCFPYDPSVGRSAVAFKLGRPESSVVFAGSRAGCEGGTRFTTAGVRTAAAD